MGLLAASSSITYLSDNFSRLHLIRHHRQFALAYNPGFTSLPDPRTTMWYSLCDIVQVFQEVARMFEQCTRGLSPCLKWHELHGRTSGPSRRTLSSTGA